MINKRRAVRSALDRLGRHSKPGRIIGVLEKQGIEVSEKLVAAVRMDLRRNEAKAMQERSKRPPEDKSRKRPQKRKIPNRRR